MFSNMFGFVYKPVATEWLPKYWANPFVHIKQGTSSLEYYYSVSGVMLNTMVWCVVLSLIHVCIKKLKTSKIVDVMYKSIIIFLLLCSLLSIIVSAHFIGDSFNEYSNYWYWDIDKEAERDGDYGNYQRHFW